MKSYDIKIQSYGTLDPEIVESSLVDAAERGENYLNPEEFMHYGEFESLEDALQAHYNEAAELYNCYKYDR